MRQMVTVLCGLLFFCGCEMFDSSDVAKVPPEMLQPGVIEPQLRVGVKVRVSVAASGVPVFDEAVKEVSANGTITLPLVDAVQCAGMTIEAFQDELSKRYAEFYVDPQVSAYYVPMNEGGTSPYGSVLVTGCVRQQGVVSIPPTRDLTVMQAIQLAGGMGQWAKTDSVTLTRSMADGSKQQVTIDTGKIGRSGATELNLLLMPGDVLDVPESNW